MDEYQVIREQERKYRERKAAEQSRYVQNPEGRVGENPKMDDSGVLKGTIKLYFF